MAITGVSIGTIRTTSKGKTWAYRVLGITSWFCLKNGVEGAGGDNLLELERFYDYSLHLRCTL